MKKIALVLPDNGLPVPATLGGAIETLAELLANENEKERRLDLTIYCRKNTDAEKAAKAYKHTRFIYLEKYHNIFGKLRGATSYRLKKYLKINDGYLNNYYNDVFKDCKKNNYDYVVAEGGNYSAFRKFSKHFGKDKIMLHIHHHLKDNSDISGIFGSTISVSKFINDAWIASKRGYSKDKNQKNYTLINAVDEEKFTKPFSRKERNELRKSLGFNENDIVVEYLGRILEVKGVKELVDAVISLNDPRIKVLVIGSAGFADNPKLAYADEVMSLIDSSGCGIHLGYINNQEVYKYAKIADIRCLPSKWEEAGSLALIEALHCGVPIIATHSGGMPEVLDGAGAIIINKDERLVSELKQSIKKIASDSILRTKLMEKNLERSKRYRKIEYYDNFVRIIEG